MNALKSALGLTTTVETEEVEVETADRNIGVLGALVSKVAYNIGAEDSVIADLMHKVWVRRAELAEEHYLSLKVEVESLYTQKTETFDFVSLVSYYTELIDLNDELQREHLAGRLPADQMATFNKVASVKSTIQTWLQSQGVDTRYDASRTSRGIGVKALVQKYSA
jgi:hypothetical protein